MKYRIETLKRNIGLDYLYTFICNLNMSSSIWVLYLAYRGMNLFQIGLLEGIHITGMITEIPSGAVADLFGRKKSLIAGRIFLTISCIVMLLSRNFAGFAIGFILHAWSYNFNSGSEEALVYDSLKLNGEEESYPKINGRINFLIEVSQGIATVAGGILAEISYDWCYIVCIIIALLGFVPLLFMIEPRIHKEQKEKTSLAKTVVGHFKTSFSIVKYDKRILAIVVYYSVIFSVFTVLIFYSQQFFSDHGLNKIQISVIMLGMGLTSCAGALSSAALERRFGKKLSLAAAYAIAGSMAAFGLNHLYIAAAALIIGGFFNALLYPIQSAALNALIPSEQRATLISLNSMTFSIVMIAMFPLAGALADGFGLPVVFAGLAGVAVLGNLVVHGKYKF